MSEIITVQDLETLKKHEIFEAEVLTGKVGGLATGVDIDYATNAATGQIQATLPKILRDLGVKPGVGDFTTGFTVAPGQRDYAWYDPVSKNWYSYLGVIPALGYVVTPGTNPVGDVNWKPVTDPLLREDLSQNDGADLVGYRYDNVYNTLSRALSSRDMGQPRYHLGYSPNDTAISDAQAGLDTDVMTRGGLNLAKKFRGIRRNVTAFSARGGVSSVPDAQDFAPQVTGVSNARGLAGYGTLDGVTAYVDAFIGPRESWESVATATYTANTCTISDASVVAKVLIGDAIKTNHATPAWGIVTSTSGNVITVDEWATNDTTVITPANGTGFLINPIYKVWGLNLNVALLAGSQATTAVAAEVGVINNSQSSAQLYPNGMDLVMLPSTYRGGAAYLARAASGTAAAWTFGYYAQGSQYNFYSGTGKLDPDVGFFEKSDAVVGMKFFNLNTYSMAWNHNDNPNDISSTDTTMAVGPYGEACRKLDKFQVLSASASLSSMTPTYIISTAGITITLPPTSVMMAGHHYTLLVVPAGNITLTGNANVNGLSSAVLTVTARKIVEVYFDGTQWQTFS